MRISEKRLIPTNPERVWEIVADGRTLVKWIPQAEKVRTQPPGKAHVGQRLKLQLELPKSRSAVERVVTECVPPNRITWSTVREVVGSRKLSPDRRTLRTLTLEPAHGGALARMSITWQPVGPLAWLLSLLVARRNLRAECIQSLEQIISLVQGHE